jgi:uncharacterized protein (TIGR00730 family)
MPESRQPFQRAHEETHEDRPPITAEQLAQQIRETADKLIRDGMSRAELKMLSTALKELRYSFKVFRPYQSVRKVTVFGSARLPASDPAYQAAVEFGRRMSQAGFMVITGAAAGIMEAGHVGAGRERSIGVNILLPFEQAANPIIHGDQKLIHLKYFFTRKLLFVKEADAIALFPGGFGTQDEGFEALTLVQTGKSHLFPIVMVDAPAGDYWTRWQDYIRDVLVARGLISPDDLSLYRITQSIDEAVEEVLGFYRVYRSMRYVGHDLVLRLQAPLSEQLLERVRSDFAGIVVSGTFEQSGILPEEGNESPDLVRLRFHFDRRSMGRLRQLVDFINREVDLPAGDTSRPAERR